MAQSLHIGLQGPFTTALPFGNRNAIYFDLKVNLFTVGGGSRQLFHSPSNEQDRGSFTAQLRRDSRTPEVFVTEGCFPPFFRKC